MRKRKFFGNPTYVRSRSQRDEDYVLISEMILVDLSWPKIADEINDLRDYKISMVALYRDYHRRLDKVKYDKEEDHFDALIYSLDMAIDEAITAWKNSIGSFKKTSTKTIDEGIDDITTRTEVETVVSKMKSFGNPKYLEIYLKAVKTKSEFIKPKNENVFNINNFLSDNTIDDSYGARAKPIRSEEEAKSVI